jgi:predicted ArsR family transcriptional regulator
MSKMSKDDEVQLTNNVTSLIPDRAPSKTDKLIELLRRDGGASIEEISEAFGWLPHSSRAKLTGLRKAGHAVERGKQGSVTTYRLVQA